MGKLSQKQLDSWNAQCSNGFKYSLYDHVVLNNKCVKKDVYLNEEKTVKIMCTIYFRKNYNKKEHEIVVNYGYWQINSEKTFWQSSGLGYTDRIQYAKEKCIMKDIFDITKNYSDSIILEKLKNKRNILMPY